MRRADVVMVAVVTTALTLMLLAGHGPWAGRPILTIRAGSHGLNAGDVPVLVLWAAAMVGCARLWRAGGPSR